MNDDEELLTQLAAALSARGWMLVTAESCTGGLISGACTEQAGSSAWFERGFVTYSNAAKTEVLGVSAALIDAHGAVSEAVARAMVQGAVAHASAHAHIGVAVTGIAGPTGGTAAKPVGTVWLAWSVLGIVDTECHRFDGDRAAVRQATVRRALSGVLERLELLGLTSPAHN